MDVKTKAIICVMPFLVAAGIVMNLLMPAYEEFSQKANDVNGKKSEQEELKTKLVAREKIHREVRQLNDAIDQLRAAVPKKTQIEILNLDIEKMCLDSGMEMISFIEPDQQTLKRMGLVEDTADGSGSLSKGKQALTERVNKNVTGAAGDKSKDKDKQKKVEPGLAKFTVEIKALGDFESAEKLVRKIETYKRVVAITELKCWIPRRVDTKNKERNELPDDAPAAEEDAVSSDWKKLWVSFLITAYYLP